MSTSFRPVHLVAHFPGVNSSTVWSAPESGSQIDFASFKHFAQTAERGLFDYLFLAEGLRLREQNGKILELDVAGRPNTLSVLAALAGVTEHLGLVGTLTTTFNEPVELARQLASVDALSGGRLGWNVVTSPDAFHGANFRRGGFLPYEERYERSEEFVRLAKQLWDAAAEGRPSVSHRGKHFDVEAAVRQPVSPQRYPVIVQAGDSPAGRDFASANAEVIFSRHSTPADGKAFYADVKGRLASVGRSEDSLKILPGAGFVLGDSLADAAENAERIAAQQVSAATAINTLEQLWGQPLPDFDPDGPLPSFDPVQEGVVRHGQVRHFKDPKAVADRWRSQAQREGLSAHQLIIKNTARPAFIGTPHQVALGIAEAVADRQADGFVLVPHLTPTGLDGFVDTVIPELQDLGAFRTDYVPGQSLRERLGLPADPPGVGAPDAAAVAAGRTA
ncbi:MAG: NtaA/DmoA family FMN-dependent monooxygenase [Arthrobacter sp.]|jgi:FMN-dependent oxidoreductase (nitrilotriacetate monooxygenase family)|nr:NtaA/DmoA family FMN-dependent monooxygenase [Arthrobacter sp.]